LPAPEVSVVADTQDGSTRTLRLRVRSPRQAPLVSVYARAEGELVGASLDGAELPSRATPGGIWAINCYAPPVEGVELTLRLKVPGKLRIRVNDISYSLPDSLPVKPRPADILPAPGRPDGMSVVTKVSDL